MEGNLELVGQTASGAGIGVRMQRGSDDLCFHLSCDRALPNGVAVKVTFADEGGTQRSARGWLGAVREVKPGAWEAVLVLERGG